MNVSSRVCVGAVDRRRPISLVAHRVPNEITVGLTVFGARSCGLYGRFQRSEHPGRKFFSLDWMNYCPPPALNSKDGKCFREH